MLARWPTRELGILDAMTTVDRRTELGEFLRTRRARLRPQDVGLPDLGRRRVPGLRREELAQLAGVSAAYYTRLEQGNGENVSAQVLDAIARALRLTDTEWAYLTQLAQPKRKTAKQATPKPRQVRAGLRDLLHALDGVPAYVTGQYTDILAWNRMAAALFGNWDELPARERNWARLIFFSPTTRDLFVDRDAKTASIVSYLRMDAGHCPDDPVLASLVGELSVKSDEFRRLWAAYEVQEKRHGSMRMRHPLVGELTLAFEAFPVPGECQQTLVTYHAEPGSKAAEALQLLASWGADATAVR
jgi:transcriptional regulator with XRE-family HTH domain